MTTTITATKTTEIRKGFRVRHVGDGPAPADTRPVIGERVTTEYQAEGVVASVETARRHGAGDGGRNWTEITVTLTDGDVLPVILAWDASCIERVEAGDRVVATWRTRSDSEQSPTLCTLWRAQ